MVIEKDDQVIIRKLAASDMNAILELVSQIKSEDNLVESARAQFTLELDQPKEEVVRFVATVHDSVVGSMGCGIGPLPSRHVLWADWLIVDRNCRRNRIASLLYAKIEQHALSLGKRCLCLDIGNIDRERAAYLFHLRNGFQIVGQIPDYWGELEHLNIMAKHLDSRR
ncbi:GNAT family N-acetyltransferase [Cupriavidus necator]|uniref:GNAT family N-acetyltransferase n=1 Tax=Cupriavidus necator TaxID=106590 RepID=UPI00339D9AB9